MKRVGKFFFCLLAFLLIMASSSVFASDMRVTLDGEYLEIIPVVVDGRSLLPARYITDILGGEVNWDADLRRVTLNIDSILIILHIDSDIAIVNDREIALDVPATIFADRTYIPLRFVAENLGVDVYFDDFTRTIVMTRPLGQGLDLILVSVTEEVGRLGRASISVLGRPYTEHEITVVFATGPSVAQGLEPKYSDGDGYVYWSWLIGSNTSFGTFEIIIAESANPDETFVVLFSVVE